MTRVTVVVLAGLSAAAVAACGSSGTKTVPKSEIISKGDAICKRLNATLPALPNSDPTKFTSSQLKQVAPAIAKTGQIVSSEVGQVRALGTPSSDAALLKQVLADGDTVAANFQAASQAAAKGDKAGFLTVFQRIQGQPLRGKQFGFQVCDAQ